MLDSTKNEKEMAGELLIEIQKIIKGPGKRYWLMDHTRITGDGRFVETHKTYAGGDKYWTPAWMTYNPEIPSIELFNTFNHIHVVLMNIDLNHPKSLTRAYLRAKLKEVLILYIAKCRISADRLDQVLNHIKLDDGLSTFSLGHQNEASKDQN